MNNQELDPNNPVKEYTGVWIPAEVMEDDRLSATDKMVYGEIASFRQCYASNAWLAKRIGKSEDTASRSVAKLTKLGYVENLGFNGRFRLIKASAKMPSLCKNAESASAKMPTIEQSIDISTKVDSETSQSGDVEKSEEYGNHQVNALMEIWEAEVGTIANRAKANRFAASNLLRKFGLDGATKWIKIIAKAQKSGDRYAPKVNSFRELYGQYEKFSGLQAWAKRQEWARQRYMPRQATAEPEKEAKRATPEELKALREKTMARLKH